MSRNKLAAEQIERGAEVLKETSESRSIDPAAWMNGFLARPTRLQLLADCLESRPIPEGFVAPPPSNEEQLGRVSKHYF